MFTVHNHNKKLDWLHEFKPLEAWKLTDVFKYSLQDCG